MLWREFKVNILSLTRIVANYVSPLFMVLIFALVFAANIKTISFEGKDLNYLQFFLPGMFVLQTFHLFTLTFSMVRVDKATRIVPLIITTRTPISLYLFSKLIASLSLVLLQILIIAVAGYWITDLGFILRPFSIVTCLSTIVLSGTLWFSMGFICGVFIYSESTRDIISSVLGLPLIFSSSIYYNIEFAPRWIQWVAGVNPLNYACQLVRSSLLGGTPRLWGLDFLIITTLAAIACILAIKSLKRLSL